MQKLIIFSFALFLFLSPAFGEDRGLASSTGYGGSSSTYGGSTSQYVEEYEYETINYGGSGSGYSGSGTGYGGSTPPPEETYEEEEEYEETYEEEYEETYEEEYEEVYEEYEQTYEETYEETYEQTSGYGGYGTSAPSYEEEYESGSSYYGGYGSTPTYVTEEMTEEYGSSSYGYGGNPSYNNAANSTYTENYEEAYTGGENGESGTSIPFVPTSLLTGFVVDIHFLAGDPRFQYIAYHYCSDLYPGYTQCDIYNGTAPNSKLVATEIIVTADIFAQLPMQERKLWHSHAFAVTSGILVSPNTPPDQELAVMASIMNSYGKVTDFYHSYQQFPYGGAKLAYGLADESQINSTIADQLDQSLGLSTTWQQRAEQRKNLNPTIIEGADDYLTSGQFPQYVTQMFPVVQTSSSR